MSPEIGGFLQYTVLTPSHSASRRQAPARSMPGWLRLGAGHRGARDRALRLAEMWIEDPDSIRIVLVEVLVGQPLRRDPRSASPPR
jgi:hypothetical protein